MKKLIIILIMFVVGCGVVDEEQEGMTGVWVGELTCPAFSNQFAMDCTQNGSELAGTLILVSSSQEMSVSGTVVDGDVSIALMGITVNWYQSWCDGTTDYSTASGVWSDNDGNTGTWFAEKR